jgi:hypothetical protein
MSVYVDSYRAAYRGMRMSHMIADTADELHAMAAAIGVQRRWFQGKASFPHYDVCESRRVLALENGAQEVDRAAFVAHMRRIRASGAASGFTFRPRPVRAGGT